MRKGGASGVYHERGEMKRKVEGRFRLWQEGARVNSKNVSGGEFEKITVGGQIQIQNNNPTVFKSS